MVLIEKHGFEGENLLLLLLLDFSVNYLLPKVKQDPGDMKMTPAEKRYEPLDSSRVQKLIGVIVENRSEFQKIDQ